MSQPAATLEVTPMITRATLAVVLLLAAVASAGAQRAPDLDTRLLPKVPEPLDTRGVAIGGRMGPWQGPIPVAVRLLSVDPQSCLWNEDVTYDVEIRNISSSVIVLPWSLQRPDRPLPPGPSSAFSSMLVSLRLFDEPEASVGRVEGLYRSPDDAFTARRLAAGASVVIRIPTTCAISHASSQRAIPATGLPLKVFVKVLLARHDSQLPALIESDELTMTVSRIDGR
jgi:hypothetical protein